jgi:hypothetical protein
LRTKESLDPELLAEAKRLPDVGQSLTTSHHIEAASVLPQKPDLQRQLLEKAKREELTARELREVGSALKQAADEEEAKEILSRPFTRTAEDIVREVRVDRLISAPEVSAIYRGAIPDIA